METIEPIIGSINMSFGSSSMNNVTNIGVQELMKKIAELQASNSLLTNTLVIVGFLAGIVFLFAFYVLWKYQLKIKSLQKKGYCWVHVINANSMETYFLKNAPYYKIRNGLYISDPAADILESDTGIRHKFFFDNSPYQLIFVPAGVKITAPADAPEHLKKKFESLAPKVLHLRSPYSSKVLDELVYKAAFFGKRLETIGAGLKFSKEMALVILVTIIGILMLIQYIFKGGAP
ncbi:MAG: hypothetical protein QW051_00675 [Candidatus Aenigmatarchaeota archaeon]